MDRTVYLHGCETACGWLGSTGCSWQSVTFILTTKHKFVVHLSLNRRCADSIGQSVRLSLPITTAYCPTQVTLHTIFMYVLEGDPWFIITYIFLLH